MAWRQSEFSAIFWNLAVAQNIRPQLPEAVANAIPFGALGLVDYLTASAPTAEVFFYQLQQHLTKLIEFINLEIVENSETFSVQLQSFSRVDSTYSLRFFRSLIVQRFQRAFPSCYDPKIIVGGDLDLSVNRGPITASNTCNGKTIFVLEMSKVNAKKALASSDKYLYKVLERSALAVLPPKRALNIVLAIRKQLRSGEVSQSKIARELGMSERTLQRRLEAIGQTFASVIDGFKHEQAVKRLEDVTLPLAQVALDLGYADLTSFGRAFKKWTGQSPGKWRKERMRKKT